MQNAQPKASVAINFKILTSHIESNDSLDLLRADGDKAPTVDHRNLPEY